MHVHFFCCSSSVTLYIVFFREHAEREERERREREAAEAEARRLEEEK